MMRTAAILVVQLKSNVCMRNPPTVGPVITYNGWDFLFIFMMQFTDDQHKSNARFVQCENVSIGTLIAIISGDLWNHACTSPTKHSHTPMDRHKRYCQHDNSLTQRHLLNDETITKDQSPANGWYNLPEDYNLRMKWWFNMLTVSRYDQSHASKLSSLCGDQKNSIAIKYLTAFSDFENYAVPLSVIRKKSMVVFWYSEEISRKNGKLSEAKIKIRVQLKVDCDEIPLAHNFVSMQTGIKIFQKLLCHD